MRACLAYAAFSASLGICISHAAGAQNADAFFAGKQIRIIVSTDAGGAYDTYARTLSHHMGRHIPGGPAIVLQYMPGAGGLRAANHVYSNAPRDGTVIAALNNAVATAPMANPNGVSYDPNKMSWIGSATRELYVGYVWGATGIKSFEDAKDKEVLFGGTAIGSFSTDVTILAREFFGVKFKAITGYKGSSEIQLGVERGEVNGVMGTAYTALKITQPNWLAEQKIRIIVQFGIERHRLFPDTPLFIDFARNEEQRKAIEFYIGNLAHGKPYAAPPGLPSERLNILRKGFDLTIADPAFLKELRALGGDVDGPMTGDELAAFIDRETRTPPAVIGTIQNILSKF